MPLAALIYTLVGFSAELDWRPLRFVKPVPQHRLCTACGVVRRKTALLPCEHTLCEYCYQMCTKEDAQVCPRDDRKFEEKDVQWRDFEELLKLEVKCWNEDNGCEDVVAVSEISSHFRSECEYHSVSCPKCSANLLYKDVWLHLGSDCSTGVKPHQCKNEASYSYEGVKALFGSFKGEFEKEVAEMRELLERMAADNVTRGDSLKEISRGVNGFKETLKIELAVGTQQMQEVVSKIMRDLTMSNEDVKKCVEQQGVAITNLPKSVTVLENTLRNELASAVRGTRDHITQAATAIKTELRGNNQTTTDKITEVLRHTQLQATLFNFVVKGVGALQAKALENGYQRYESDKVYLRGYYLSPGVSLEKEGESAKLYARLVLRKGDMDDFVPWPFPHKVGLSVVHPKDGSKREFQVSGKKSDKYFQKPTQSSNEACYMSDKWLRLSDLFSGGFVENDTLFVQWELLP